MLGYDQTVLWPRLSPNASVAKADKLSPLLKWAGGKEQELKHILPLIPTFQRYYEPFIGGGAVFFAISAAEKFINDKSSDLFNFYIRVAEQDKDFLQALDVLLYSWQSISQMVDAHALELTAIYKKYSLHKASQEEMQNALFAFLSLHQTQFNDMVTSLFERDSENFMRELKRNLVSKTERMRVLESKKWQLPEHDIIANIECALKSAFYMHLRHLYNTIETHNIASSLAAALFFFVRENAYASMFRYNSRGAFNVPYGGIAYNRKDLARKIAYLHSARLQSHLEHTIIENLDFEDFLQKHEPQAEDFIFLDPPYDSEFSTYSQNVFGIQDQERLASYLLHRCKAKFMLVIKNTPTILKLYSGKGVSIGMRFDKKYLVSFQARNNRDAEHLVITNY